MVASVSISGCVEASSPITRRSMSSTRVASSASFSRLGGRASMGARLHQMDQSCGSARKLEAPSAVRHRPKPTGCEGHAQDRAALLAQRSSHLSSAMYSNTSSRDWTSVRSKDVREFEGVVSSPPLVRAEYGQLLRRAGHHIHRDLLERTMHAIGGGGVSKRMRAGRSTPSSSTAGNHSCPCQRNGCHASSDWRVDAAFY